MTPLCAVSNVASMTMPAAQEAVPDKEPIQRLTSAAYAQAPAIAKVEGTPTVATERMVAATSDTLSSSLDGPIEAIEGRALEDNNPTFEEIFGDNLCIAAAEAYRHLYISTRDAGRERRFVAVRHCRGDGPVIKIAVDDAIVSTIRTVAEAWGLAPGEVGTTNDSRDAMKTKLSAAPEASPA